MSDKKIYEKIESVYNSEKGKNFVAHLIRSFFPVSRTTFMLQNIKNKKMKCCVTGAPLISRAEFLEFQIENAGEIFLNLAKKIQGEKVEDVTASKFKGKFLAVECVGSDKLLSAPAYQELYNFVVNETLKSNPHIKYIILDERRKENPKSVPPKPKKKASVNAGKPSSPNHIKSVNRLGDNDVLQNLKNQLESKGK